MPKEIRWNHIDLGSDGTLTPRASYQTGRSNSIQKAISAQPQELVQPKDPGVAIASFLNAIEQAIDTQQKKRFEPPKRDHWQF